MNYVLSAPYILHGQDAYMLFGRHVPEGVRRLEVGPDPAHHRLVVRWTDPQGRGHEMDLDDIDVVLVAMKLTC